MIVLSTFSTGNWITIGDLFISTFAYIGWFVWLFRGID